ncbi:MAG TPA: glycosyltransferase family 4 protein [Solimonas sp.]
MRILFLSYNGLTSRIGQAQVLPYLSRLAAKGHEITVVAFENDADRSSVGAVLETIRGLPLHWLPQTYSTLPGVLAKIADTRRMKRAALAAAKSVRFDIVHCRSYVPADAALAVKRATGARFLFDMRGFWVDQRLEGNRWPQTRFIYRWIYRRWKRKEARYIASADGIVLLTEAARAHVVGWSCFKGAHTSVIPCSVDFTQFDLPDDSARRLARSDLGVQEHTWLLVYLGSLGSVYLLDDILRCFAAVRAQAGNAHLLFVGSHPVAGFVARAKEIGLDIDGAVSSRSASYSEVPAILGAADVGLCFIIPTFSSAGVSPTKLGEYLACGLPAICNVGVGDVEQIIRDTGGGIVVGPDVAEELQRRSDEVLALKSVPRRDIRQRARAILDVHAAVDSYDSAYRALE